MMHTIDPREAVATRAADRRLRLPMPRWMRGRVALLIGIAIIVALIVLCYGAPVFTSYSATTIDPEKKLLPIFSPGHFLGTDQYGRDLFARILYGGRYDIAIVFGATSVTLVAGTLFGLVAGHFGGKPGRLMMRFVDFVFAFPFLVFVIAVIAILGPALINMFIALWLVSWVGYARITHSQTQVSNEYGYVVAARALGFGHLRIMLRHQLPTVVGSVVIFAMVDAVGNVLLAASLGFLGLGVPEPAPEWGGMIARGQNFIFTNWNLSVMPGLALVLLGVGLSLIGDAVAERLRAS